MVQGYELRRTGLRGLIWPAVFTLAMLPVLIGLGVWQLQRLAWKEGLMASIADGLGKPPAPLEQPPEAWKGLADKEYRPVSVVGHFRHQDERRLFATAGNTMGWHIYTPLQTEGGRLLFVNRGFVPDALKDPASRAAGEVAGQVTVTGLVRKPGSKGWFEPDADLARNIWYWRDLEGMTASLASEQDRARVLPFFVDAAVEPANPGGWPKGGVTRLDIPNRHLEYALTWFGLAATLVAVFAAFAWTRLRSEPGSE
ncbi:SURF1 family protein [Hyphomicrobium sp.]|uniref:SURF1 family protein n=1 Tax=Hyphomicrobium sp. TaxID=82 RepID=UPI0025C06870|nr:SURF1 family protein [Hyphomicrobium sp.]MCC7252202.1 SURF1 family protein [Hyphomicrobium sp.]